MDPLSISDRLESTTPVRSVGKNRNANSDGQRRERSKPKPDDSNDSAAEQDAEDSHQLDELA
jgi:hypothetical protein